MFQLLLRFYDPLSGQISLAGVAFSHTDWNALRERVGIVSQDAVAFASSGLKNIRYARLGADDAAVQAAAHVAFAHKFTMALPEGNDSFLDELGVRLSGGRRQRIAIARAMLKNPLLLLDEATGKLDAQSERMVQAALESVMRGRITPVIAHRLATVQQAERILVRDHGRLVEEGSHAPYRPVKFHQLNLPASGLYPVASANFTHDEPIRRVTEWGNRPGQGSNSAFTTLTIEERCDDADNNFEHFYLVKMLQKRT